MNRLLLKSSCLAVAAVGTLALAGCEPWNEDRPVATARYAAPVQQPSPAVRDAQARLVALGDYTGPVDGLWGPDTENAVQRFQRDHRLVVTANLDDETWAALRDATSTVALDLRDPTDIRALQNRLRQLGYYDYYDGRADGVWGRDTQLALEEFQRARGIAPGGVTVVTINAMGLDPAPFREHAMAQAPAPQPSRAAYAGPLEPRVIRGVQVRLQQLGFYRGPADGIWGAGTQAAVAEFQKSRGLEASGALTPTTASMMGLNPNNLRSSTANYRR
jgi:peptidoglycan hydrolase-like protein with peptidoglycan-binding domain